METVGPTLVVASGSENRETVAEPTTRHPGYTAQYIGRSMKTKNTLIQDFSFVGLNFPPVVFVGGTFSHESPKIRLLLSPNHLFE